MLSRILPKFTENMSPRALIAALNQLVEALGRLTGFRPPAAPLGQMPDGQLYLDDTAYKRIPARLTAVKTVPIANQPTQLRHAFIQQVFDPTTGIYSDFTSGLIGDGVLTYATELNNGTLSPLTATIPAAAGTGPLVWLRSKGIINSSKVYEFDIGTEALEWVKVTSSTAQTIYLGRTITDGIISGDVLQSPSQASFTSSDVGATLIGTNIPANTTISEVIDSTTVIMSNAGTSGSGQTVQIVTGTTTGYAAVIDTWSNRTGDWSDGAVVWLVGANTELPQVGVRYQCRLLGVDDQNVQIWGVSAEWASLAVLNSTTLHGTYYYDGNLVTLNPSLTTGGKVWLIDGN